MKGARWKWQDSTEQCALYAKMNRVAGGQDGALSATLRSGSLEVLMFRTKMYWQRSVRDDCSPLAALDQFQLALTALYFLEPLINPQRK